MKKTIERMMKVDITTITQLVSSVGFPIVCCGALFYYQNYTMKQFMESMNKQLSTLSENIQNCSHTIDKLSTIFAYLSRERDENNVS